MTMPEFAEQIWHDAHQLVPGAMLLILFQLVKAKDPEYEVLEAYLASWAKQAGYFEKGSTYKIVSEYINSIPNSGFHYVETV